MSNVSVRSTSLALSVFLVCVCAIGDVIAQNNTESPVMTKDESGKVVNACAEKYGLSLGLNEIIRVDYKTKEFSKVATNPFYSSTSTAEEIAALSHDADLEGDAELAVKYKLMSTSLKKTKGHQATSFISMARKAAKESKFDLFIDDLNSKVAKYTEICDPEVNSANTIAEDKAIAAKAIADDMVKKRQLPKEFDATFTCTLTDSVVQFAPIRTCFGDVNPTVTSELEVTNGDQYNMYTMNNIQSAGHEDYSGLHIHLNKKFEIKAQNSSKYVILNLIIQDAKGKKVFEKSAARFGVIHVRN